MILPACAGVILKYSGQLKAAFNSSRMRGGDPRQRRQYISQFKFFPHARG